MTRPTRARTVAPCPPPNGPQPSRPSPHRPTPCAPGTLLPQSSSTRAWSASTSSTPSSTPSAPCARTPRTPKPPQPSAGDIVLTPLVAQAPEPVGRWTGNGPLATFNGGGPYVGYTAVWNLTGN